MLRDNRKRLVAISKKDYNDLIASVDVYRSRSNLSLALSSISLAISLSCLVFIFVNL